MPNFTASLVIITKLKTRCRFCTTAILCRTTQKGAGTVVGMVIGDKLEMQAAIPGSDKRFISSPEHPDWLWS
jgi:hypothetical protein